MGGPRLSHLELAGVVAELDLEQEAVLAHLVLGLVLQLLDEAVQQTLGLELLLGVLQVYGVPEGSNHTVSTTPPSHVGMRAAQSTHKHMEHPLISHVTGSVTR